MPYALRFYLYLLVAGAFVLAVWLTPLGAVLNAVFAIIAAYLTIVIGRRVFGGKNLKRRLRNRWHA